MTLSEARWREARRGAEACRELLRAAEAGRKRDLSHGIVGLGQPALGLFDAQAQHEAMRRRTGRLLECTQEMPLAKPNDTAHRGKRQRLAKVLTHVVLEPTHPGRRGGIERS